MSFTKKIRTIPISISLFGALVLIFMSAGYSSTSVIVLGLPLENKTPFFSFSESIYREISKRMDVKFQLEGCIPKLCLDYIKKGRLDGEAGRVKEYVLNQSDLIVLDSYLIQAILSVYAHDPSLSLKNWKDLDSYPDTILYQAGNHIFQTKLKSNVHTLGFEHLIQGVEEFNSCKKCLLIGMDFSIDFLRKSQPEFTRQLVRIGDIDTIKIFPILHKKHHILAGKMNQTIKEMHRDKSLNKMCLDFKQKFPTFYCEP